MTRATASSASQRSQQGRVVVAGSVNMDIVASADRYPRLGETVFGKELSFFPGGKGANQAVAAASLGAPTLLIGKIGRDAFGGDLRNFLTSKSVDLTYLTDTSATSTGTAIITTSESDNAIVVIPGANARLDPADFADVLFEPSDVLVAQFEIPQPTIKAFFEQGKRAGARTILNPAPASKLIPGLFDLVDVLVLNESELALLSSQRLDEASSLDDVCGALRVLNPAGGQVLCATLGSRGAVALISGEPLVQPAQEVTVVDTTGAGDCFVGAVACELARGSKFVDAMTYGQVAASICVQRRGAGPSMPTYQEIARHF